MPKFSKEDLDTITTYTGLTAAVCIGLAGIITHTVSDNPGDKVMGVSKEPIRTVASILSGVGGIAIAIGGVFTNKTASMHPTTSDLEERASVQEQADFFKYSPNGAPPPPRQSVYTGVRRNAVYSEEGALPSSPKESNLDTEAIGCNPWADDEKETYYLLSENLPPNAPSPENFNDEP